MARCRLHAEGIQTGLAQTTFKLEAILPKLGGMLEISILSNIRRVGRKGHRRLAGTGKEVVLGILGGAAKRVTGLKNHSAPPARANICAAGRFAVERMLNQLCGCFVLS